MENLQIYVQAPKSYYNFFNNDCKLISKIKPGTPKPKEHSLLQKKIVLVMWQPKN